MTDSQLLARLVKEAQLYRSIEHELTADEELHWDSMSLIWFIASLEEHFGIALDYRTVDLREFATLQSIERFIRHARQEVCL